MRISSCQIIQNKHDFWKYLTKTLIFLQCTEIKSSLSTQLLTLKSFKYVCTHIISERLHLHHYCSPLLDIGFSQGAPQSTISCFFTQSTARDDCVKLNKSFSHSLLSRQGLYVRKFMEKLPGMSKISPVRSQGRLLVK